MRRTLGSGRVLKYRVLVLVLTFFTYTMFHMSRKAPSIVKSSLHPHTESNRTSGNYNPVTNPGWQPFSNDLNPEIVGKAGYAVKGSSVCGINSDNWQCQTLPVNGTYSGWWCRRFVSPDGKFSLHVDEGKSPRAEDICAEAKEDSRCWVISGIPKKLNNDEKNTFCRNYTTPGQSLDCAMYIQPGGHHIPAPADDNITWVQLFDYQPSGDNDNDQDNQYLVSVAPLVTNGKVLLGACDTCYLIAYAIGLFFSGHIADHMSLRLFLTVGMIGSGAFVALIGLASKFDIHSMWYFYLIYAIQGLFQASGWPAVVAVMANWFGKGTRGLVMGVWNAHTSVGNILGSVISSAALGMGMNGQDWPAAFYISGGLVALMGVIVFFFLPNHPHDVGLDLEEEEDDVDDDEGMINADLHANLVDPVDAHVSVDETGGPVKRNSFIRALCIPGVVEFAMALFFCKFVAYMFIYWLPYYLAHNGFSASTAGNLSTAFDVGGIIGGVIAGAVSDCIKRRAPVAYAYLALAIPALYFYRAATKSIGDSDIGYNILLMIVCGAFVNGPYALITTAVSADLGNHPSLKGDLSLTATVTGIIDGTGSVGASIQGILIGAFTSSCDWDAVFYLLMIMCALSSICLTRLVLKQGPEGKTAKRVYRVILFGFVVGALAVVGYCIQEIFYSCHLGNCGNL